MQATEEEKEGCAHLPHDCLVLQTSTDSEFSMEQVYNSLRVGLKY